MAFKKKSSPKEDAPASFDNEQREGVKPKARIILPLTDDGKIDMERLKDPDALNKARAALGQDAVLMEPTAAPEVPKEFVPVLFDGVALAIQFTVKLAKWPAAMTDEQRGEFATYLTFSDEFKRDASEPTANLLNKTLAGSKWLAWIAQNQDAARLIALMGVEVPKMFQRAAERFVADQKRAAEILADAQRRDPMHGFPPSENRGPVAPNGGATVIAQG